MEVKEKIKEIIQILKTGGAEEVKNIKKELRKLYHNSNEKECDIIAEEFISEMKNFDSIKNPDNRANFIYALWVAFLQKRETHFDFFMDFLIERAQDKNGKIRNAALNIAGWIYPFPPLRDKIKEKIKKIEPLLLQKYYQPKFARFKYIKALPVGIYKSLQMMMEKLCEVEKRLLQKDLFKEHKNDKWELYYDAMEFFDDYYTAEDFLKRAIELDNDFVAAYAGLTELSRDYDDDDDEEKYAEIAWEKTLKKFPEWPPDELNWGSVENRQYLRAICNKAMTLHKKGEKEKAEKIYRLLLKLNPGDNQGVRYLLAGLFRGLMPENVDKMNDEGNKNQNWSKLEKILYEENKKHKFFEYPVDDFPADEELSDDVESPDEIGKPHGTA
ncbi:MAG: hypothetical protein COT16_01250 [Elusimicrobia bacterium CG08_land_8_20_14_0_20_44_26]|nr:MAG: hypothetical protein COT16_01250 [Elusimicrobia bacterium CG08_land_8_20_14_0_20_44_26]